MSSKLFESSLVNVCDASFYKFKIRLCDFSCDSFIGSSPHLKVDFDSFKIFKLDSTIGKPTPAWKSFKASFVYKIKSMDQLSTKFLKITTFDNSDDGKPRALYFTHIDLLSVACGPHKIRLNLSDSNNNHAGILTLSCSMELVIPEFRLTFSSISVRPAGKVQVVRITLLDSQGLEKCTADFAFQLTNFFEILFDATPSELFIPGKINFIMALLDRGNRVLGHGSLDLNSIFKCQNQPTEKFIRNVAVDEYMIDFLISYPVIPPLCQMHNGYLFPNYTPSEDATLVRQGLLLSDKMNQIDLKVLTQTDAKLVDANTDLVPSNWIQSIECPEPWRMKIDKESGTPYFVDKITKHTTWEDPRFLPCGWHQRADEQGVPYYVFEKNKTTTYLDPRGCPEHWHQVLDSKGDAYFACRPCKSTTWTDPRGLPEGVFQAVDPITNRDYFRFSSDFSTSWEDPRAKMSREEVLQRIDTERKAWWNQQIKIALESIIEKSPRNMGMSDEMAG